MKLFFFSFSPSLTSSQPEIEVEEVVSWIEDPAFWLAIGTAIILFIAFWLVGMLLFRVISPALKRRWEKKERTALNVLLEGFGKPLEILLRVLGLCYAIYWLSTSLPASTPHIIQNFATAFAGVVYHLMRVSVILTVAWGLLRSSSLTGLLFKSARHRMGWQMSKSVSRFLGAVYKVVVLALAAVILLSEFNYDVNGLVAGLGLGGLTVALAAKDSAANFFGGLVLVTEKPFEIGDWIVCQGIEGTVEDINLRSTQIRTGAGACTIVPNSILSAAPITNWSGSQMKVRRADFSLGLARSTPREKLKVYCDALRTLLERDVDVANESIVVRFSQLADSSLNVMVRFDTLKPGYADYLGVLERINFQVIELAEQHGVEFAFPSRTLYLYQEEA